MQTTATLLALVLGSGCLSAQESTPQIKKVPVTSTSAASGKEMFNNYCASCHGVDGKGDGPPAPALKQQPADLTVLAQKNGGKFPTSHVATAIENVTSVVHGSKEMPVWGPILSSLSGGDSSRVKLRIHNITDYLKSLQAK